MLLVSSGAALPLTLFHVQVSHLFPFLSSNLPALRFLGGPTRTLWLIFTSLGARLTQRQFERLSEKDVIAQR